MGKVLVQLLKVFSSNLFFVVVGLVTGLVLPKYISKPDYAVFQTYFLYASYIGVVHFGFVDGVYIKYGGKSMGEICRKNLVSEFMFLLFFQVIVAICLVLFAGFSHSSILLLIGLSILPINMLNFYKFFFQSISRFGTYAKINAVQPFINMTLMLLCIFGFKVSNPHIYIGNYILSMWVVFIAVFIFSFRSLFAKMHSDIFRKEHLETMRVGLFILLGNLSMMLVYSLGRWFVKIFMTDTDFADYAWSDGMMNKLFLMITAVAMTFYPMLVKKIDDHALHQKLKTYLVILGAFSISSYFLLELLVQFYLTKYVDALPVIQSLLLGLPAITVINALFVNLFKARKQEKKYVQNVGLVLLISLVFNSCALYFRTPLATAIASLLAFYCWYFFNEWYFSLFKWIDFLYIVLVFVLYVFLVQLSLPLIAMPVYLLVLSVLSFALYKKEFLELKDRILGMVKKRLKKD